MSSPVRAASLATGLMSGMWIQCAPRSNGTPKRRGVGDAAPADAVARLDQREARARRREPARRGDPGRAGADDRHVDLGRWRRGRAERRARAASAAEPARKIARLEPWTWFPNG